MYYSSWMTIDERLREAIRQAREAAMATGVRAFIHAVGNDKFLVNSESRHSLNCTVCCVLPSLDVIWNEEKGESHDEIRRTTAIEF